jgi:hypothetical protein
MGDRGVTRRTLLERAALGAGGLALGAQAWPQPARAAGPIGLPTPAQVRSDFQTMVDFGPRLTGSEPHNRYIAWLEREFAAAGCNVLPCDVYETDRWEVGTYGLDVLEGTGAGAVKVGAYFPRCRQTPAEGVSGPLVYGGSPPPVSINGSDPGALQAGLARWPADVQGWASALPGTLSGSPQGAILLVDLPLPIDLQGAAFAPLITFYNGSPADEAALAATDYKRAWVAPGLAMPLAPFAGMGAAGVVFVLDISYEALRGSYLPFESGYEDVPALYVDRDTGARLRAQAAAKPKARLTLTATRKKVPVSSVTAVLPGTSDETIIFNTHTDGQGFVEENGGVAFVQIARHFGSLPADQRLKRTLVFAAWPGHMANDLPQAKGWIDAHADIVGKAAAALTIEHLGCSEWIDSTDKGYHATGQAEMFAVWTSAGQMFEQTKAAVVAHDLPRTPLMRAPAQFGVGMAFQGAGVPQIGAIAGPTYLLGIVPNGDMDKLDEALAAKQIACIAEIATRVDKIPAAELKSGDPTLGGYSPPDAGAKKPPTEDCSPPKTITVSAGAGRRLTLRWYGRRRRYGGILLVLQSSPGPLRGVTVELWRGGKLLARRGGLTFGARRRRVVLKRSGGGRFPDGRYTIVVRRGGRVIARRSVTAP